MATVVVKDENGKRPVQGWIDIHSELAEGIKDLEENMDSDWISREEAGKLAEREEITTQDNMMAILSTYREYIESETDLESKEKPENQGSATVYWRVK